MRALGLVVEGHGEVAAVPVLVRRIFAESDLRPRCSRASCRHAEFLAAGPWPVN